MLRFVCSFFVLLILPIFSSQRSDFGFIAYSTTNIGDDIQALAAMQFLPKNSIPIDREFIHDFRHPTPVNVLVNGWFMHTKRAHWQFEDVRPPEKSWPPSSDIRPFFISFHLTPKFTPEALSEEGIAYLRRYAPIGARDLSTLDALQKAGIPSYFSGCLSLTLENPSKKRKNVIYAVDIPPACLTYLQSRISTPIVPFYHGIPREICCEKNLDRRFSYAREILEKYGQAKCVITTRLHAAMPCLAMKTPVFLIAIPDHPRYKGLSNLCWHASKEELLSGQVSYDFDNPPENKNDYLKLRDDLIARVTSWIKKLQ